MTRSVLERMDGAARHDHETALRELREPPSTAEPVGLEAIISAEMVNCTVGTLDDIGRTAPVVADAIRHAGYVHRSEPTPTAEPEATPAASRLRITANGREPHLGRDGLYRASHGAPVWAVTRTDSLPELARLIHKGYSIAMKASGEPVPTWVPPYEISIICVAARSQGEDTQRSEASHPINNSLRNAVERLLACPDLDEPDAMKDPETVEAERAVRQALRDSQHANPALVGAAIEAAAVLSGIDDYEGTGEARDALLAALKDTQPSEPPLIPRLTPEALEELEWDIEARTGLGEDIVPLSALLDWYKASVGAQPSERATPRVKALEWNHRTDMPGEWWESQSLFGWCYNVRRRAPGEWIASFPLPALQAPVANKPFGSLEQAQAACQSDYERRVLSALEGVE